MNLMTDLETLGTAPRAMVLEMAFVPFDADGVYPDRARRWYLQSQGERQVDPDTLLWWLNDDPEKGAGVLARDVMVRGLRDAVPTDRALQDLLAWYRNDYPDAPVWARGAAFDLGIMRDLYDGSGLPLPWSHRAERCSRTVLAQGSRPNWFSYEDQFRELMGRAPVRHAALDDCVMEALELVTVLGHQL